ncbi:MAG: type II secretion system F family protein [Phycisphaeraceae bacterium]|nr:type II secretion system F family protein [Phycisphaeraceae bacterium]
MPVFEYIALSAAGKRTQGVLSGASEQAVLVELEARQLVPVSIQSRPERRARRRVSTRALAARYQQLADLLRAGVPLLRALKLIGNRRSQPRLSDVFRDLAEGVSQGEELAAAMERHPDVFPKVHIAMVKAGEKGGFLDAVLNRLSLFVQHQAELRSKVIGSLTYPAVLIIVFCVAMAVIFGVFVPRFKPMYAEIVNLPLVTKIVFGASSLIASYGVWTAMALALLGVGAWRLAKREGVRRKLVEWKTRAIVIGPLVRALAASRFCRMLGTMLGNGIPMLTAMQIARDAAGNLLMEEAIDKATEAVRAGESLSAPLQASGLFSDDVVEMINVAESANNLDEVLLTIAGTIDSGVDRMLSTVIRLVEPMMLLIIALIIATVAAGLILPMTRLQAGV